MFNLLWWIPGCFFVVVVFFFCLFVFDEWPGYEARLKCNVHLTLQVRPRINVTKPCYTYITVTKPWYTWQLALQARVCSLIGQTSIHM